MTWEQRWHPLRREWVIIAAHRQNRPWSGERVVEPQSKVVEHAADCFLCPGNARVSGKRNPPYEGIYTFDNDHPCVGPMAPEALTPPASIYQASPARGLSRVICYTPRHDLTLAELELDQIVALLVEWQHQMRELGVLEDVRHVLIFENKGEVVGVSNPHPHCQLYATNFTFRTVEVEDQASADHFSSTGRILFQDIIAAEQQDGRRILFDNEHAIAFVPYFARYAYETCVAPKRTVQNVAELDDREVEQFAEALQNVVVRFDNLWKMPFPYVMALHQAPTDGGQNDSFHFHIEFHPPLRMPNLQKYLAGPEIGGGCFVSDTSPEEKARELLASGTVHYRKAQT